VLAFPITRSSRFSMCLQSKYPRPIILPAASALPIWAISATIRVNQRSSSVRLWPLPNSNYQEPIFRLPWVPSIRNLNHLAWDIPSHQCFCFCSWPIANCELLFAPLLNTNYRFRYQLIFSLRVLSGVARSVEM
jgi:hypothetical protein